MKKNTYIVAVSGGVDSVVLLHKLNSQNLSHKATSKFVVAHFDHGIRPDSAADAEFVLGLAEEYGLSFECERAELGEGVSEGVAREYRYKFLRSVKDKHQAEAIITAHHQDDLLETMIIGLLRRSGARSMVGFTARDVLRPLISMTKSEIVNYADQYKLSWREDSTNSDLRYLRNYVRLSVMHRLEPARTELLQIRENLYHTYQELDRLTLSLLVQVTDRGKIRRSRFVVLPYTVQKELIRVWLMLNGVDIDSQMIKAATLATKVLPVSKQVQLCEGAILYSKKEFVLLNIDA